MRKALFVLPALVLAAALTGCGSAATGAAIGAYTGVTPVNSLDQDYLAVATTDPVLALESDDDLIEAGHVTCESLDNGMTLLEMAQLAKDNGVSMETVGTLAGASVGAYCPEYTQLILDF